MGDLSEQLASLNVTEQLRKSKRLSLPPASLVKEFETMAITSMNKPTNGSQKIRLRRIKSRFGVPPIVMAKAWELMVEEASPFNEGSKGRHSLWALYLLKVCGSESELSGNCGISDEETFRNRSWYFIGLLAHLTPVVVSIFVQSCVAQHSLLTNFPPKDQMGAQGDKWQRQRLFVFCRLRRYAIPTDSDSTSYQTRQDNYQQVFVLLQV